MSWLIQRKLTQNSKRLQTLRAELSQLTDQASIFLDDASDQELRAMVSETPGASGEAVQARKHAAAYERQRRRVQQKVDELEAHQDELLDRLNRAR